MKVFTTHIPNRISKIIAFRNILISSNKLCFKILTFICKIFRAEHNFFINHEINEWWFIFLNVLETVIVIVTSVIYTHIILYINIYVRR